MTRDAARIALAGGSAGLVVGVSWLPVSALLRLTDSLALDFAFVPAGEPAARALVGDLHELDAAAVWVVSGVFGRIAELLGWTEALRLTAGEPGTLAAPLAEALHAALEDARTGVVAGADLVLVADDLAGAAGPLLSPDFALDALLPCYRAIAAEALARGVPVAFHSDGDIRALMPALARAEFSSVHLAGIGRDMLAPSLDAVRAAGLAAFGGIAAVALAVDPAGIGRSAGLAARDRGLVVCDDGALATAAEIAAYRVAVEAARAAYADADSSS